MENNYVNPPVTEPRYQYVSEDTFDLTWIDELLGPDPFEAENFMHEHRTNGTTKDVFDRRKVIDQKNVLQTFIGDYGMKWDAYGECTICGTESYLRCEKCPWVFYCSRYHQVDDWNNHRQTCMNVLWYEDGHARATRDLPPGTVIMEKSTIFVAPRFHTPCEMRLMPAEDYDEITDGPLRPCFGCHELIQPFLNSNLVCEACNFPVHCQSCASSPWHKDECKIFQGLNVRRWYDEFGHRENIMIYFAVLRGILLKESQPLVWNQIIALDPNETYMTSPDLKNSTIRFIFRECKVDWIPKEEIVHFLSIFMKHRLNCCMAYRKNKKMVSVICSGMIPFTLVKDEHANVQGGVYNYRMRMTFHTIKPVVRGEIFTIGRGVS